MFLSSHIHLLRLVHLYFTVTHKSVTSFTYIKATSTKFKRQLIRKFFEIVEMTYKRFDCHSRHHRDKKFGTFQQGPKITNEYDFSMACTTN